MPYRTSNIPERSFLWVAWRALIDRDRIRLLEQMTDRQPLPVAIVHKVR